MKTEIQGMFVHFLRFCFMGNFMNQKRQDEIAAKAVRKSTLRSIKVKKNERIKQLKLDYQENLRKIELQYAKDPERLKAKYLLNDSTKSEKAKKRAERKIAREEREIELNQQVRQLTIPEEICCSIIQGIGAALFIAVTAILDTIALRNVTSYKALTCTMYSLFGASMIIMYVASTLSHALTNLTAKDVFRRLSHGSSFLVIGFAYTAYAITKIGQISQVYSWILFGFVWLICIVGAVLYSVFSLRLRKVNIIFYCIAGFCGVIAPKILWKALSTECFKMLCVAAAFYLLGLVFYANKKIKFFQFVGNILFLAGSIFLFFSMFFIGM
jgi:hemolysin III